jgi:hypothetical protein
MIELFECDKNAIINHKTQPLGYIITDYCKVSQNKHKNVIKRSIYQVFLALCGYELCALKTNVCHKIPSIGNDVRK